MNTERVKLHQLGTRILNVTGSLPVRVFIRAKRGALVRFTNNGIHQNGFQDLLTYQLRTFGREGAVYVESNDCSKGGIEESVDRLRQTVHHPLSVTDRSKIGYPKVKEYFPFGVERIPAMAQSAIDRGLRTIRGVQASANGYYSAYERYFYLSDAKGLALFHPSTAVRFGVTIARGAGKGYFSFYHPDSRRLDVDSVVRSAMNLAEQASGNEVSIEPGEYECICSPRAFLELIEPLRHHFNASLYKEGKSVFSGRLNQRIFSPVFTLTDDVTHREQFGLPFDADGQARRKTVLIDRGILKGLLGEGTSTRGIREHPVDLQNLVVKKSEVPLAHLVKRISRGIWINKLRYHTLVGESEMTVTGLATAGCLYIEKGRLIGRIAQLRYHDSLFSILESITALSREQVLLKDGETGAALLPYFLLSRWRVV